MIFVLTLLVLLIITLCACRREGFSKSSIYDNQRLSKSFKNFKEKFGNSSECELMKMAPDCTNFKKKPQTKKYIVFQIDCGGLNNIKMQYEILTVLAWLSGRTLVLHPKRKWYLLGSKELAPDDVFDLDCWSSQVPVITTTEFSEMKKVPYDNYNDFFKKIQSGKYGSVAEPEWSPGKQGSFKESYIEDSEIKDKDIWYFYCNRVENFQNADHRMFGTIDCYYQVLPVEKKREMRRLIAKAIQFKKKFYEKATEELKELNLKVGEYNAVHLRNWEGSKPQFKIRSQEETVDSILKLDPKKPILFLSQDVLKDVPKELRDKVDNLFQTRILVRPRQNVVDKDEEAVVEMLMALGAHKFIGSPSSTYSTGIMYLRGLFSKLCSKIDPTPVFLTKDDKNMFECKDDSWNFHVIEQKRWTETFGNIKNHKHFNGF